MAVSTIDRVREAEQKANEKQNAAELEAEQMIPTQSSALLR